MFFFKMILFVIYFFIGLDWVMGLFLKLFQLEKQVWFIGLI